MIHNEAAANPEIRRALRSAGRALQERDAPATRIDAARLGIGEIEATYLWCARRQKEELLLACRQRISNGGGQRFEFSGTLARNALFLAWKGARGATPDSEFEAAIETLIAKSESNYPESLRIHARGLLADGFFYGEFGVVSSDGPAAFTRWEDQLRHESSWAANELIASAMTRLVNSGSHPEQPFEFPPAALHEILFQSVISGTPHVNSWLGEGIICDIEHLGRLIAAARHVQWEAGSTVGSDPGSALNFLSGCGSSATEQPLHRMLLSLGM